MSEIPDKPNMQNSDPSNVLPTPEDWKRLRSQLSAVHHEKLDRIRFTTEKIGSDRLGIDFALIMLIFESHYEIARNVASILPRQRKEFEFASEKVFKQNRLDLEWIMASNARLERTIQGSIIVGVLALAASVHLHYMVRKSANEEFRQSAMHSLRIIQDSLGNKENIRE